VTDFTGSSTCSFKLRDLATGVDIDYGTATKDKNSIPLQTDGRSTVYLDNVECDVSVSAG
jgi:hypothetical protein